MDSYAVGLWKRWERVGGMFVGATARVAPTSDLKLCATSKRRLLYSGIDKLLMAFLNEHDALWQHIEHIVFGFGLAIYDLEQHGRGRIIVSIMKGGGAIKNSSVTSDDCSKLLRELMTEFEAGSEELGVASEPEIEVCSPGINRKLRLPRHFIDAVGQRVKAVILPDKKLLIGTLVYADEENARIDDEQSKKEVQFALGEVKSAGIDFKFD